MTEKIAYTQFVYPVMIISVWQIKSTDTSESCFLVNV